MVQETYEKYEDAMVLGKDSVPCLAPLSDSSAASSTSCDESLDYSPHNKASTSEALSIPEVINEVSIDITASDNDSEDDKHVRFGSIEIRCYPVILGDHPECAAGPPITIGWEHFKKHHFSVDDFEVARPERRNGTDLVIPWMDRKKMLRRTTNSTDEEMREAICDVQRIRKQRQRSRRFTPFANVFELPFQSMKRTIKRRWSFD